LKIYCLRLCHPSLPISRFYLSLASARLSFRFFLFLFFVFLFSPPNMSRPAATRPAERRDDRRAGVQGSDGRHVHTEMIYSLDAQVIFGKKWWSSWKSRLLTTAKSNAVDAATAAGEPLDEPTFSEWQAQTEVKWDQMWLTLRKNLHVSRLAEEKNHRLIFEGECLASLIEFETAARATRIAEAEHAMLPQKVANDQGTLLFSTPPYSLSLLQAARFQPGLPTGDVNRCCRSFKKRGCCPLEVTCPYEHIVEVHCLDKADLNQMSTKDMIHTPYGRETEWNVKVVSELKQFNKRSKINGMIHNSELAREKEVIKRQQASWREKKDRIRNQQEKVERSKLQLQQVQAQRLALEAATPQVRAAVGFNLLNISRDLVDMAAEFTGRESVGSKRSRDSVASSHQRTPAGFRAARRSGFTSPRTDTPSASSAEDDVE
jgi:hypothetical protein